MKKSTKSTAWTPLLPRVPLWLNSVDVRDRLAWTVLCVGFAFVPLKMMEWLFFKKESLFVAVARGLEHRIDDPSFWTIMGAAVSCILLYKVSSERACAPRFGTSNADGCPVLIGRAGRIWWFFLTALGWTVYLRATCDAGEALFAKSGWWTQILEGLLNLFAVSAAYLFAVVGFCTVRATQHPAQRLTMDCRQRCYSPAWLFFAVLTPAFLLVILLLLEAAGFGDFVRRMFNWKFTPFKGKSPQDALGIFFLFWAPGFALAIYALLVWRRSLKLVRVEMAKFLPPFLPVFCTCSCVEDERKSRD